MVLIGTIDGRMFTLGDATDMLRAEFKKFPGPQSIKRLHECTGLDSDGILAILCYLEFHEEIKSHEPVLEDDGWRKTTRWSCR